MSSYSPEEESKLFRLRQENPGHSWAETRELFCLDYKPRTEDALKKKYSDMTKKVRKQQPVEVSSMNVENHPQAPHENFSTQLAHPSTLSASATCSSVADCNPPFPAYIVPPENNPCAPEDLDRFFATWDNGQDLSELAEYLWNSDSLEGTIATTTCSTIDISAEGSNLSGVTYK